MAQMIECSTSRHKALSLNPSITKKQNKTNKQKASQQTSKKVSSEGCLGQGEFHSVAQASL
jgi:hypothetical protein